MFKETMMPDVNAEGEESKKGYEIKKSEEKNKIKTDYDVRTEAQTIEHKSQEWEKIDANLQNGIKEIAGDEFTVKFISITRVMDEAGIFDAAGSIELIDKEGKRRKFHVEHHYKYENKEWYWTIEEKL